MCTCSIQKLRCVVKDIEQEYKDLLTETGRCAPPEGVQVQTVTKLHSAMEDLMDIAACTLGAAQHGATLPPEVMGQPYEGISALCEALKKAQTVYFSEARRFCANRKRARDSPGPAHYKCNLAPKALILHKNRNSKLPIAKGEDIVQHLERGGLVDRVAGANLMQELVIVYSCVLFP